MAGCGHRLVRICNNFIFVRHKLIGKERKGNVLFNDASTHFIYGYMASDIWLRTILIVRKETRCRHIGYSFRLTARVLLYAPSHRQDSTYHGLCYTSRGALAGMRNSSMGSPHEGSIRRPNSLLQDIKSGPPEMFISRLYYDGTKITQYCYDRHTSVTKISSPLP